MIDLAPSATLYAPRSRRSTFVVFDKKRVTAVKVWSLLRVSVTALSPQMTECFDRLTEDTVHVVLVFVDVAMDRGVDLLTNPIHD